MAATAGTSVGRHDTHPSLGERVDALGASGEQVLRAAALPERPAGADWMDDWPAVVARQDAAWQAGRATGWQREHLRTRHRRRQLDALRAVDDTSPLRARLEIAHGDAALALTLARRWLDDPVDAGLARYLLGAGPLAGGEQSGIETLEDCIRCEPSHARAARTRSLAAPRAAR